MKRIYGPEGDVAFGGVVIHDYAVTKAIAKELARRHNMSSIKKIQTRLNNASKRIRTPKLSFTELYLAKKEELDSKYPYPERRCETRDPDGFRYSCNNPHKTPIENLCDNDI